VSISVVACVDVGVCVGVGVGDAVSSLSSFFIVLSKASPVWRFVLSEFDAVRGKLV